MPLVRRHVGCLLIGILQILLLLSHSQRFNCETATCAKDDVWTNVSFPNSTEVCEQLQINALSDLTSFLGSAANLLQLDWVLGVTAEEGIVKAWQTWPETCHIWGRICIMEMMNADRW